MIDIKNELKKLEIDESIIEYILKLPSDYKQEFSTQITEFVTKNNCEDELRKVLNGIDDSDIQFKSFYSLIVLFKHEKNSTKLERLLDEYDVKFSNRPLLLYSKSLVFKEKGGAGNLKIALQYANESIDIINDNSNAYDKRYAGFYNNYAEIVAQASEEGDDISEELFEKAIEYINKAFMYNKKYPKYYCTLGRLQSCMKNFDDAKENIKKAIDNEDSKKNDYALRIAEYQDYLVRCNTNETLSKMEIKINEKTKEIERICEGLQDEKGTMLEFLGFFSAIITFIISPVQISTKMEFKEAVSLILVMLGALIIVFGTLRVLLKNDKKAIISTVVFSIIGIVIIAIEL